MCPACWRRPKRSLAHSTCQLIIVSYTKRLGLTGVLHGITVILARLLGQSILFQSILYVSKTICFHMFDFLVPFMNLKPRKPKATPKPPTTPPPPHLKEAGAAWGRLGPGRDRCSVFQRIQCIQCEAKEQKAWDEEVSNGGLSSGD